MVGCNTFSFRIRRGMGMIGLDLVNTFSFRIGGGMGVGVSGNIFSFRIGVSMGVLGMGGMMTGVFLSSRIRTLSLLMV